MLAPVFGQFNSEDYVTLTVTAIAAAVWGALRSLPIAAGVGLLIGVVTTVLQGYIPPDSFFNAAVVPSLPFLVIVVALLFLPGMRSLDSSRDPLATIDPPPPPIAATTRAPTMNRIIRVLWWVIFAGFCISMLTWIPSAWATVFNNGITYSIVLLSITLITGMAGQLSLCQATLAGVGAFTAAQLANHLGLNLLVGGLVGAALAAAVAVILALLSLRLRGLGLALMTLAAALAFDATFFNATSISGGPRGREHPGQVAGHHRVLRLRRPRHVPALAGRARRGRRRRPHGAQGHGGAEPGRHAGQRDGHGRARREPLVAAHHGLRPVRRHRRDRRPAPQH